MSIPRICISVIFAMAMISLASAQTTPAKAFCTDPHQKQFDFWIGQWDLSWPGAKAGDVAHGHNHVTHLMDGCVVQENFDGGDTSPMQGMSVSVFDLPSGKWKQTWVDNQGAYLDFTGEFHEKERELILAREAAKPDGSKILQRMVYKNLSPNEFDWSWEQSSDGGKTWVVQWPIHYKRHA